MIYFDHAASTPPYDEVIQTMMAVMQKHYANPSSLHHKGQEAAKLIQRSREQFATQIGTVQGEWLFTSGGTEANNLALKGAARQFGNRGKHIITTEIEHASVIEVMKQLEAEGFRITYLPVQPSGHVKTEDVKAAITKETILVSVMHVNNELGTIQPIEEIGSLLTSYPTILFHVDAVQSLGKLPIDIEGWGIDLVSGSAHKHRGPRGVGVLYVREGIKLYPLISGGSQETGLRAGTENVPAIVASAKAIRMSMEAMPARLEQHQGLSDELRAFIDDCEALQVNGHQPIAPHLVHFSYPGMKPEVIIHMLEQRDILASTKSACSSKDDKPSRVLLAIGADHARATSGIRISFGDEHTMQDVIQLKQALLAIMKELKPLGRR